MLTNDDFRALVAAAAPTAATAPAAAAAAPTASRHRHPLPRARPYPQRHPADFAVQESAARVLRSALAEKPASLRESRCFRTVPAARRAAVFACACETTKRLGHLQRTLHAVPGLATYLRDDLLPDGDVTDDGRGDERWVERASGPRVWLETSLACVMLHDLLLGDRWLDLREPRAQLLLHYRGALDAALRAAEVEGAAESAAVGGEVEAEARERYLLFARVNPLRGASVERAAAELRSQGWEELPPLGREPAA